MFKKYENCCYFEFELVQVVELTEEEQHKLLHVAEQYWHLVEVVYTVLVQNPLAPHVAQLKKRFI